MAPGTAPSLDYGMGFHELDGVVGTETEFLPSFRWIGENVEVVVGQVVGRFDMGMASGAALTDTVGSTRPC